MKVIDAIPVIEDEPIMDDMIDECELEYHLGAEFVEQHGDTEFGIWMIDHVDGIIAVVEGWLVSIGWLVVHGCGYVGS